ncbi:MAG: TetR/AcrR family transcriptional regulator [Streptosporangiaceae bacterium]
MSPAKTSGTRERILAIAREQFARQGFTGTSIADIAGELGTTTAALYYHFSSKADILAALLEEPMAAYTRILRSLDSGSPGAEDLLSAFIDLAVDSREMATIVDRDPAVLAMIDQRLPRTSREMTDQVIAALAGPDSGRAGVLRAYAAFAAVKDATLAAVADPGSSGSSGGPPGTLDPADRAEILAAALRALRPEPAADGQR